MSQSRTGVRARARILVTIVLGLAASALPLLAQPAAKPLASRDLDVEGVTADVIESVRKDNVLTVRVRFRNTSDHPVKLELTKTNNYNLDYISAGNTKYNILRDTNKKALATPMDNLGMVETTIPAKGSWNWWAKFPAPPADQKTYTLYLKVGPPIEDVPIVDR